MEAQSHNQTSPSIFNISLPLYFTGSWFISVIQFLFLLSVRLEQGTVTSIIEEDGIVKGVQYKTKNGQELTAYAPLTIVCDGGFSNLRRKLCKPQVICIECIDEVIKFPIVD